jgi:organic radical activating enzyme
MIISGRSNLACTIFFPKDCKKNCPFCTSKKLYKEKTPNLKEVLRAINIANCHSEIKEFVITGGEPLSDLDTFKKIVNECQKPVYVNTIFPKMENVDEWVDYLNFSEKVKGISVSRHLGIDWKDVIGIETLDRITKPIRINCVKMDNDNFYSEIGGFIKKYGSKNRMINIRADYTKITPLTLKNRNKMVNWLLENGTEIFSGGCMVCNENVFEIDGNTVAYHRGLEHSSFTVGKKTFINDILVLPNGEVYKDWDFQKDSEFDKWFGEIEADLETLEKLRR